MARTVILIDDDQDDLDILKETLESIDPSLLCISFVSPVEAIRVVTEKLIVIPDYIITDINMPELMGDHCIKEFRNRKEFNTTVITVLSTGIDKDVTNKLKGIGANYAFQKPNSFEELKHLLLAVFERNMNLSSNQTTV